MFHPVSHLVFHIAGNAQEVKQAPIYAMVSLIYKGGVFPGFGIFSSLRIPYY